MKQRIHELLNDITIDLDEYTVEEIDEVTEERWIRKAKKSVRRRGIKKILKPVAAVALLVIGTGYALPVYATTNPLLYKIADFIGMNKTLDRYSSEINETVAQNGLIIQLGEVILDNDEIMVAMRITSEEPVTKSISLREGDVYINGEAVGALHNGWDRKLDEHTWEVSISTEDIKEIEGDVDIKIILREFDIDYEKLVRGKWEFEFTANGDELRGETLEISLQERMMLPEGEEIIVERYTANAVSQKIYFTKAVPISGCQIEFDLYNEAGEKFKQISSSIDGIGGVFKWEGINSELKNDTLILSLSVAKWGEEYKKVDQEIKINLFTNDN